MLFLVGTWEIPLTTANKSWCLYSNPGLETDYKHDRLHRPQQVLWVRWIGQHCWAWVILSSKRLFLE